MQGKYPAIRDFIRTDWGFHGILVKFKLEVGVDDDQLLEIAEKSRRQSAADLMVANTLDVGIVSLPVRERELAVTAFHRHELVAIAPPDRRWRRGQRVRAAELAREPLILFEPGATLRRVIDEWFQRAGVAPTLPMELNNTEAIKKLVESGLGLSVTSWFSVEAEVRARTLAAARLEPPLYRDIGVIRRKDKPKTPVLEAFLATLDGLRRSFE